MRNINEIIIHCSATRPDWYTGTATSAKVDAIRSWHRDLGWGDIGYHYIIDRDGTVVKGRPVKMAGAHCRGHNLGSIGICLIGGHGSTADDKFSDNFTDAQYNAMGDLVTQLKQEYGYVQVTGHNLYANKACPGFRVHRIYSLHQPPVEKKKEEETLWQKIKKLFTTQ